MVKFSIIPLLGLMVATNSFAETIRITSGEWGPFASQYSYQYGIDSHIVTEAFKLEGINVEWGFFPWVRAYHHAKNGNYWDASCCWRPREGVQDFFLLSEAVTKTSFVFFHLKSYHFDWSTMKDLKELKIGLTAKFHYGKQFMDAIETEKLDVQFTQQDIFNFKKLLAGRIEIFPNDPDVGTFQIKNLLPPESALLLTHSPKEFGKNALHLLFSKNSKRSAYFLDKFTTGLKKLKKSGRYEQMLQDMKTGKYDGKSNNK
jgi:polar amino acid transport system substrate-binding protein